MAHFEAMFDAKICCFSAFLGTFSLQPKQLQPDYVSSHYFSNITIAVAYFLVCVKLK